MSRKVFTAGEVLAAADVNNFLMNQTVMSFAGTASRAASIPTPVEGMYTHLEDSDDLQFWNGSAWVSPFGMTLLVDQSFSSQSTLQFANVFSATYAHYRLNYRMNANANSSLSARMVTGTTPTSGGTDYTFSRQYWTGTGGVANNGGSSGASSFTIISQSTGGASAGYVDIYQPFLALPTLFNGMSQYSVNIGEILAGRHGLSNSYTGLQIDGGAGAMTGNIQIYGYRIK
jgi:hypothetical protein